MTTTCEWSRSIPSGIGQLETAFRILSYCGWGTAIGLAGGAVGCGRHTFETTRSRAGSVHVKNLGTHFYANSVDEEDRFLSGRDLFDPAITSVTGAVTGVQGREFTIDTGARQLTVDTATMSYNPLDQQGSQRVKKGDRVSVRGSMDSSLFTRKELDAISVVTLSRDQGTKGTNSTGK